MDIYQVPFHIKHNIIILELKFIGVKEAVYIRAIKPSLNRDWGHHRLPKVYDPILTSHTQKVTTDVRKSH